MNPTLSGAERGKVQPIHEVPGGLWLLDPSTGTLSNVSCSLRLLPARTVRLCQDVARQYLQPSGTEYVSVSEIAYWTQVLHMHYALVAPGPHAAGAPVAPLFPLPVGLIDKQRLKARDEMEALALHRAADGQLDHLAEQYALMVRIQCPAKLTQEQWEAIVSEGKAESLKTLISRHGSSALIQVLHGTAEGAWAA